MNHRIHNFVLPNRAFGAPDDMYARCVNDAAYALASPARLKFLKGGRASFDTFFNAFSLDLWKGRLKVLGLTLVLRGTGSFLVRLGLHRLDQPPRWIYQQETFLSDDKPVSLMLPNLQGSDRGLLYLDLLALSDGEFHGGGFDVTGPVAAPVKLGIVVTHFNRISYVSAAIERLEGELFSDPDYRHRIQLVVVDNSRNLPVMDSPNVTVIPNDNYGGSGGFARGLLHLRDEGSATHCLFMDDDASCEVESIRRTLHVMELAGQERVAVSGALLREVEPYRLFEKGGRFSNGRLHARKIGLDLRDVRSLLIAEQDDSKVDYGAWWHFAFPIGAVRNWPFPFFVRGDDVLFSLQNQFEILTLNGIASWGEDFHYKDSPLTRYLATRSEILLRLNLPKYSRWRHLKLLWRDHRLMLVGYNYASAQAIAMGVEDVLKGPRFWSDNLDNSEARRRVANLAPPEKMGSLTSDTLSAAVRSPRRSRPASWLRRLTMNGLFLPKAMMKNRTVYHQRGTELPRRNQFRFRRIAYVYEQTATGYVAEYDKIAHIRAVARFVTVLFRFFRRYQSIQREYSSALNEVTRGAAFWENVYRNRRPPVLSPYTD